MKSVQANLVLTFLLLLATFNSAWAAFAEVLACHSCVTASDLVGDLPLGWIGVAVYASLSVLSLLRPSSTLLRLALSTASLLHLILVGLLILHSVSCAPCLTTAASAWLATGAAWLQRGTAPTRGAATGETD